MLLPVFEVPPQKADSSPIAFHAVADKTETVHRFASHINRFSIHINAMYSSGVR